jgi:hypothetical protein
MRVTSTVPEYVALAGVPDDGRAAAWTREYEAAHPEIFRTYHSSWGRHERCVAAAADVPQLAPGMPAVERRARDLIEVAERSFRSEGLLDDDLDVVLMVGAHTSDGWVTELGEAVTLFLALEFLADPPFDGVLVSHEAFHVAHARHGAASWPEDCAASLFQEGLAVAVSREIHPGLDDSAYLWFDDAHAGWVRECESAASAIARRAHDRLAAPYRDPAVRSLFTTRDDDRELPPRAGYWLGDRVVRRLLERQSAGELLGWDHATTTRALAAQLSEM